MGRPYLFVTGTDGAESVQSVDQPDKFLHIDGSTVTLSTTATPVVRTSVKGGVAIRAAATPSKFLRHTANSALTVSDKATVFRQS
jgi:hypothetical protein